MNMLAVLSAVALVFAAGFGLTLTLWRDSRPLLAAELFGLSWFLGAGIVSALLALCGIVLSGGVLLAFVTACCLASLALGRARLSKQIRVHTGIKGSPTWERWICVLALIPVVYFAVETSRAAIAWDGLLIWEFKARSAFLAGGALPSTYFSDAPRLQFHPGYPLYLPFTELWVYLWVGECHQTSLKFLFPIFYTAGIALLWAGTLRLSGRLWVSSLTALLPASIPLMSHQGFGLAQGYCDFLLASVYFASVSALLTWHIRGISGAWFIAAACAGLLPWMKQEGSILFASMIVQAAVAHGWRGWKTTLLFAAPGVVTASAWKVALWLVGATSQEVFQTLSFENLLKNIPRLELILRAMSAHFLTIAHWSLLWYLAPVALGCLAWQRRREAFYLAIAVLVPLVAYIVPYMFTRLDLAFHLGTSLDRLMLQVSTIAVFGLGLALGGSTTPPARNNSETES